MSFAPRYLPAAMVWGLGLSVACAVAQPLPEVLGASVRTHPAVGAAIAKLRVAQAEGDSVKFAWSPRVGLEGSAGAQRDRRQAANGAASFSPGLRLRKLVHDGGRTDAQESLQRFRSEQALWELRAVQADVSLTIGEAYIQVARAKVGVQGAQKWLEGLTALEAQTQEIASVDRGRGVDVSLARARVTQARSVLLARQSTLAESSRRLNELVGKSVWVPPDAQEPLGKEELVASGVQLENHPRIQAAHKLVEVQRSQLVIDSLYDKPKVEVEAFVNAGKGIEGRFRLANVVGVQLVTNQSLFDGGAGKAALAASAARVSQAEAELMAAQRVIQVEEGRLQGLFEGARTRLSGYEAAFAQAQQVRLMMIEQFRHGRRPLIDLLGQESEIYQAGQTVAQEQHDLWLNTLRVLHAQGQLVARLGLPVVSGTE